MARFDVYSTYSCASLVDRYGWTSIPDLAIDMLFLIVIQAVAVILLSKLFHLLLRRYNQPSVISQILAGIVVGGMGLRSVILRVDVENVEDMYGVYISAARLLYMFIVGLNTDIAALRSSMRRCVAFTYATVAAGLFVAAIVSSGLYSSMMHSPVKNPELLASTLMLQLTNTSPFAVVRIASDLKLMVTESGRLIVSAAIVTNIICIIGDGILSSTRLSGGAEKTAGFFLGFLALVMVGIALWRVGPAVTAINQRNIGQRHVRRRDLVLMLLLIWFIINTPTFLGFDGLPTSFALGLMFPREGPAARSVADALGPPLKGLLIPFYFATMGMRMEFKSMSGAIIVPGILTTLLGLAGKAIGAAVASPYLHIPLSDALRFSVLLNVKGHVDNMNMKFARSEGVWAEQALYAMIIGNLASTLISGPAAAAVLRKERTAYAAKHQAMESLREGQELRMLACAHSAHATPGLLSLMELLVREKKTQPAVHVLHLVDAFHRRSAAAPWQKKVRDGFDAIKDMNSVVDLYCRNTGVAFRQVDKAARRASKDADAACKCARNAYVNLLLVPCYKEQRYDGKMACRLEERRQFNDEVLARAPCSVGLLMDRPYRSCGASFKVPGSVDANARTQMHPCRDHMVSHVVAAVFLGGPDDREAVSFAARLAENDAIGLTVFRFVKRSTYERVTSRNFRSLDEDGMDAAFQAGLRNVDDRFMWKFNEEYANREMAMYVEKVVETPADVVETLDAMAGMFSLVIVGRGGRQPAELLVGLDQCEEAGGLVGPVAEILASNDSLEMGSVLIIQQHTVVLCL